MKLIYTLFGFAIALSGCSQSQSYLKKQVGGPCEDCHLMFDGIPVTIDSKTILVDRNEPGEPLIIRGIIYKQDGKTPASGVILYVYQTDNAGLYARGQNQTHAVRHGHIRGWVKTNTKGEYEFKTIRPASYPNSNIPQHIHPIIYEPDKGYYWIDEYQFEDDPKLTPAVRQQVSDRGGSGIIKLTKDNDTWLGQRDIILGFNVSNY
ncbi:MAG: intradiol ring-cleavage dioxygenase [Cyclobacteriaceae bacterium]|nr:intradiol ring-cleavage dioxygenase [Cyclobacteriaceae bacterium]